MSGFFGWLYPTKYKVRVHLGVAPDALNQDLAYLPDEVAASLNNKVSIYLALDFVDQKGNIVPLAANNKYISKLKKAFVASIHSLTFEWNKNAGTKVIDLHFSQGAFLEPQKYFGIILINGDVNIDKLQTFLHHTVENSVFYTGPTFLDRVLFYIRPKILFYQQAQDNPQNWVPFKPNAGNLFSLLSLPSLHFFVNQDQERKAQVFAAAKEIADPAKLTLVTKLFSSRVPADNLSRFGKRIQDIRNGEYLCPVSLNNIGPDQPIVIALTQQENIAQKTDGGYEFSILEYDPALEDHIKTTRVDPYTKQHILALQKFDNLKAFLDFIAGLQQSPRTSVETESPVPLPQLRG